jgi:hypothetical protein
MRTNRLRDNIFRLAKDPTLKRILTTVGGADLLERRNIGVRRGQRARQDLGSEGRNFKGPSRCGRKEKDSRACGMHADRRRIKSTLAPFLLQEMIHAEARRRGGCFQISYSRLLLPHCQNRLRRKNNGRDAKLRLSASPRESFCFCRVCFPLGRGSCAASLRDARSPGMTRMLNSASPRLCAEYGNGALFPDHSSIVCFLAG